MKALFIVNKDVRVHDLLSMTGIRETNFWFEHIAKVFIDNTFVAMNFVELVDFLSCDFKKDYAIRQLNLLDVDGNAFVDKCAYVLDCKVFNLDFSKVRSRKLKVIVLE